MVELLDLPTSNYLVLILRHTEASGPLRETSLPVEVAMTTPRVPTPRIRHCVLESPLDMDYDSSRRGPNEIEIANDSRSRYIGVVAMH